MHLIQQKTENFVNVNALSSVRKLVRPIEEQGDFESRRMWREVTFGLKYVISYIGRNRKLVTTLHNY